MDCRNFKELLDSYLSDELAVETNHACLRHAEHCPPCRAELAARRKLRGKLRQACQQTRMSAEAQARLRACLRAEGAAVEAVSPSRARRAFAGAGWFSSRLAYPLAAALLIAVGWLGWSALPKRGGLSATLSTTVLAEAAGDHRTCAAHFADKQVEAVTPDWMKRKFPAYAQLAEVAAKGSQGLVLKSVHVCSFQQRQFAHLVYGQNDKLISLLVTRRDGACLATGQLPHDDDDGLAAGLQHASSAACQLGAFQTAKYVVFVVSELPDAENQLLAERLAAPVSEHLRRIERAVSEAWPLTRDGLLADLHDQVKQAVERRE